MNEFWKELASYIKDYTENFDHFPIIFVYEDTVYDINISLNEIETNNINK